MRRPSDPGDAAHGATTPLDLAACPTQPITPLYDGDAKLAIARGTLVGRYQVQEVIGAGGMGVVVAAIDPTLQRTVALKLVREGESGSVAGRAMLVREAQAMAQLSHPNVVTVFEVGTLGDDGVFIAMELVRGMTLAAWLAEAPRSRRQIVDAYMAAGTGLAAAHRANIVHRDFKPSNVLIDAEGRVRVADFGVATVRRPPQASAASLGSELPLTPTAAMIGTPHYMAPEQHRGEPADARADQFAFCVALHEALHGELPFASDDYATYRDNVLAGRIREPPDERAAPAWLRRIIARGLAVAPTSRYPTMDELLEDLARDPALGRRRLLSFSGAALTAAAAATLGWQLSRHPEAPDPCAHAGDAVAAIWNPRARDALAHAFAASGVADATATFQRVAHALERRAASLADARREACQATARHEQSDVMLDRRIGCLERRGGELAALVSVLGEQGDRTSIERAIQATAALPPLVECNDRTRLLAAVTPPTEAQIAAGAPALQQRVDRASALFDAGRFSDARDTAAAALAEATPIGYAPLSAQASFVNAQALVELGQPTAAVQALVQTAELAAAAGDDVLIARSWILRYSVLGYRLHEPAAAAAVEPTAATATVRAGNSLELRGHLSNARGVVALAKGDDAEAASQFLAAAKLFSEVDAHHPRVATAMTNAGVALHNADRFADAKVQLDRGLALRIEIFGDRHPLVAHSYKSRGSLRDGLGDTEGALADFRAAYAIEKASLPADHPALANTEISIAIMLRQLARSDEALELGEHAVRMLAAHPDADPAMVVNAMFNLAGVYVDLQRTSAAIALLERALALSESKLGSDDLSTASVLHYLADVHYTTGQPTLGDRAGRRALAIREATSGPMHTSVGDTLTVIAFGTADKRAAVAAATRAIAIYQATEPPPLTLHEARAARGYARAELDDRRGAIADLEAACDPLAGFDPDAGTRCALRLADVRWRHGARSSATAGARQALATLQRRTPSPRDAIAKLEAWISVHR